MSALKNSAAFAAAALLSVPSAFAGVGVQAISASAPAADAKMVAPDYIAPYGQATSYVFDESAVNHRSSALYEVRCQTGAVLSALGVSAAGKKITSLGYEQDGLNVNVDLANCAVNAYPVQWSAGTSKGISKEAAVAAAKKFAAQFAALTLPTGAPVVTMTDRNGGPALYAKDAAVSAVAAPSIAVETDDKSDVAIDNLYQSVTVLFPFDLGKGLTYATQFGAWPEGLSVTVNGDGKVTGMYGSAKFSLVKRASETLSKDGVIAAIKKRQLWLGESGGQVKLSVKRSLVQFDYAVDGVSKRFLSTGYLLKPTDPKWENNGGIGVSDYLIGNQN